MKKFILNILFFFITLPIVIFILTGIYGIIIPEKLWKNLHTGSYGHIYTRLREADTTKNIDVLVVGSSHAYRGFDPRIFKKQGLRLFNLGSSSQTPIQTEYLLKLYLDRMNPGLIIYEVNAMNFSSDGLESSLDLYSNLSTIDKNVLLMAKKINKISSYNTLAYLLFRKISGLENTIHEPAYISPDIYVTGGFVERKDTIKNKIQDTISINEINLPFNCKQISAFENTIKYILGKNIRIVLVQAPVSPEFYSYGKNNLQNDRYFSSLKNIPYFNFNTPVIFTKDLFYDQHHLIQKGVEKFNKLLLDSLNKNGIVSENKTVN